MAEKSMTPEIRFKGFTDPWEQRKLGDIFEYEQPQPYIVSSTEYDERNPTPVLTAGQSFTLGYTDETYGIKNATPNHPVVIFDDFTTSSHYVDFPFKVKSSAMKILTLAHKEDDIHVALNALQGVGYEPVSHERHWISKFADFQVLMPKSSIEQGQIGRYFADLDTLITLHQRKYDKLVQTKKAMLDKMFPKPGETEPEIRFKGFTDPWEQRKLGEVVTEFYCGQTPYRQNESYWNGAVNWLASGDLNRGLVVETAEKISTRGKESTGLRIVPKGTVVIATMGQEAPLTRGNCGILDIDTTINQACMALYVNKGIVDSNFLFQWYKSVGNSYGLRYTQGTKQQNYNAETLGKLDIALPKIDEQRKLGAVFASLDSLITLHQRKLELLRNIKKAMLDKMFI